MMQVNGLNAYGVTFTEMFCAYCGDAFTVTPAVDPSAWGAGCLADNCRSYDVNRDPTFYFVND